MFRWSAWFCVWWLVLVNSEIISNVKEKPNFVVLFADDFGWGDVGANYAYTKETPNLDAMASKGLRLTRFYSGASVCTPARAALLTGRLGQRTGVTHNFEVSSIYGLPEKEISIADFLKKAGYSTGMVGKWHLGTQTGYLPVDRGFDFYYGLPYSNDMGCTDSPGYDFGPEWFSPCPGSPNFYTNLGVPLYFNRDIIEQPVNLTTLAQRYVEQVRQFVTISVKAQKPFFLYVPFAHTHVPLAFASQFNNSSPRGPFGDTLYELDWAVGQIIDIIHDAGLDRNTLMVFTGDNGPWNSKNDSNTRRYSGSQGPFVGGWQTKYTPFTGTGKLTTWEGGMREPAFFYWPSVIKPGQVSTEMASNMDLLPTFCRLANVDLPKNLTLDGADISDLIFNNGKSPHKALFHYRYTADFVLNDPEKNYLMAVNYGDYKAHFYTQAESEGPILTHDPPLLFNIVKDYSETFNLSATAYSDVLLAIQAAVLAHNRNMVVGFANYSTDNSKRPCCNPAKPACRC